MQEFDELVPFCGLFRGEFFRALGIERVEMCDHNVLDVVCILFVFDHFNSRVFEALIAVSSQANVGLCRYVIGTVKVERIALLISHVEHSATNWLLKIKPELDTTKVSKSAVKFRKLRH